MYDDKNAIDKKIIVGSMLIMKNEHRWCHIVKLGRRELLLLKYVVKHLPCSSSQHEVNVVDHKYDMCHPVGSVHQGLRPCSNIEFGH